MDQAQKEVQQAQLNDEKKLLKLLERVFEQAIADCEDRIRQLSMREDLENLQSIIYQQQYQQMLVDQLEASLTNLQQGEFTGISQYLQESYYNGYVGVMYDIAQQGIPLTMPIPQDQVVKALRTNSKLSKPLYDSLGEDVNYLKKTIRAEISRGISNGSSWNEMASHIAKGMKLPYDKAYNRAVLIARTEGHRIQNEAALEGQQTAKKKGADIVKQWDATLDARTRPEHREADGQLREVDEDFDVGGEKLEAPGVGGSARNVCNCRCCLLQRARWALDEDEMQTLKDRAAYFGLDKTESFEKFKDNYLKVTEAEVEEAERYTKPITYSRKYAVQGKTLQSREYVNKFESMAENPEERRAFYRAAKEILQHRSGQNGEDLYYYNSETKKRYKSTTGRYAGTPEYTEEILDALKNSKRGTIISFHNHPASMPPSIDDINSAFGNGYKEGYILCHDGKIYKYSGADQKISDLAYDLRVALYRKRRYNEFEAQLQTILDFSKEYGFLFEEVK